jgi:hypothetical protein
MNNILDGWFIQTDKLKECIDKIKTYTPSVLILSKNNWNGILNAIAIHQYKSILFDYRNLGITQIVWAEDIHDGEFMLSSTKGLPTDIETIFTQNET